MHLAVIEACLRVFVRCSICFGQKKSTKYDNPSRGFEALRTAAKIDVGISMQVCSQLRASPKMFDFVGFTKSGRTRDSVVHEPTDLAPSCERYNTLSKKVSLIQPRSGPSKQSHQEVRGREAHVTLKQLYIQYFQYGRQR